jgi:arylsulfatase A-like enzyme
MVGMNSGSIRRREFVRVLAAAGAVAQTTPRRPNVILIMTDDQGYGDLSGHGNARLETPNLDRFAAESVEFTRFTVSSVCAPTRASLLTGRYALRCGVHGVTGGKETMRRNEVTVARALQAAGYRTALFGKWHLGENYPYVPHASGFDEFVGFRLGHWSRYFDSPSERNGKPEQLKGYVTDALTNEAIGFAERNRARPFFLYLALNAPHSPYQAPDKYFDRHKDLGDPELAAIHAMVENIDDNVGRLLAALDRLKLRDGTIVIFLCDNGPQTQRYVSGLRGRKGQVYEGGTRSPFFLRWPGHMEAGRKVDRVAAHIDVFPTLLELCGVKAPSAGLPVDGVSLAPLLSATAGERAWPPRLIFSHADHQPDPLKPFPGSVRDQRWKMVNGAELYDLVADPAEAKNVAAENPAELQRLDRAYREWFASVTARFTPGAPPIPVGYWEENPAVLSAPQAKLAGGAAFYARNGFAHDFIKGWDQPGASATWRIDVAAGGRYEVWVQLLASAADLPVRFSVGLESLEARTAQADSLTPNVLPERSPHGSAAPDMTWSRLRLGRLPLEPGVKEVTVQGGMTYVKAVELRRVR